MLSRLAVGFLALFLLLYGLAVVTNFRFDHMGTVTGIVALIAGVLCAVCAFRNAPIT